jgi:DNA invertase Pin-like site-specific DNA recombinase
VDRLARSIKDLQDIVYGLNQQGVTLRATEQPVDTRSAAGKAFLDMLGVDQLPHQPFDARKFEYHFDAQKHELIRTLRLAHGKSLRETVRLAGVSKMTVIRVCNKEEG